MRIFRFGLLLMAGVSALAQAPGKDLEKQKQEIESRINQIKALKSQQQGTAYLMSHLYESLPGKEAWFLEIRVDGPESAGMNTSFRSVVHIKGVGKSQTSVTRFVIQLERRKDWFPAVTLKSIRATGDNSEAGPDGREFEMDVTHAAQPEAKPAKEKSDSIEKERVELERELESYKVFIPVEEKMGKLIQNLNRVAIENHLRITKLEPQMALNDRGFYQEETIKISIVGGYHDIASYFDNIGRFKRIITIRNLSIKREGAGQGPNSRKLNADFDAVSYLQKPRLILPNAQTPAPEQEKSNASLIQDDLIYRHLGDNDPFWSALIDDLVERSPIEAKGSMKYKLEELTLTGFSETNGLKIAMLSAENKPYFVKAGDQCYDATVLEIDVKTGCVKWRQVIPQTENNLRPYKDVTLCLNAKPPR